jgi:uncharacterized protein (TIGR00299 family) protein
MSVLFLDPVGGIAGDMTVAALLDLGADLAVIRKALAQLPVEGIEIDASECKRGPFSARRFTVACAEPGPHHRHWSDIRKMLTAADLSEGVMDRALRVFQRLAEAEARVHGIAVEEVHFHEVGAWDSIADIVGVAAALDDLGITEIIARPPPLSTGTIQTAHGAMPLPAPATVVLLEGWPVRPGPHGEECTTPTGAAILAALAQPGPMPAMIVRASGMGAGTRDPADRPNVLRAVLGERTADATPTTVHIIEAQMDDMSGEHLPPLIDALLAAGAVDAFARSVLMKKGRTGLLVTALAPEAHIEAVEHAMLRHGTTFGVRRTVAARTVLERWHDTVTTPWGDVRIKVGALDGEILQSAPEYEDVQRIASQAGRPTLEVHAAALAAWRTAEDAS